jgi:hypothetical protein
VHENCLLREISTYAVIYLKLAHFAKIAYGSLRTVMFFALKRYRTVEQTDGFRNVITAEEIWRLLL